MGRGERAPGQKWLSRDWALAQALTQYEAMICTGCGQPLHESMDPDSEDEWVSPLPMQCHACTAIAHRVKDYQNFDAAQALRFHAERRPTRRSG